MLPFGKTANPAKTRSQTVSTSILVPSPKGDTSRTSKRFFDRLTFGPKESLHPPTISAALQGWGLTPTAADKIANTAGYLDSHHAVFGGEPPLIDAGTCKRIDRPLDPSEQKHLFIVCQTWAPHAPEKARRLIDAALPLIKDSELVRQLLVDCVDVLLENIQPRHAMNIADAIVQVAKEGWAMQASPNFVPQDVRGKLAALAEKIDHDLSGVRVRLHDLRHDMKTATPEQLPELMLLLQTLSQQAMASDHVAVGPAVDIADLADRLARQAGDEGLRRDAHQLNVATQRWRIQRAQRLMRDWLTIDHGQSRTGGYTAMATCERDKLPQDPKLLGKAQKALREWLRAQLLLPPEEGLSWSTLMDCVGAVAGDPPGEDWIGPDHGAEFALREGKRSNDWQILADHLRGAKDGSISARQSHQILDKLDAIEPMDPQSRSAVLSAMLHLLPPKQKDRELHTKYLHQLWRVASARVEAAGDLLNDYLQHHPLSEVDSLPRLAAHVTGILRASQAGAAEQRLAAMKQLLREPPKPRAGTQWLTWEPACHALLDTAIDQIVDTDTLGDLLIRWLPRLSRVPNESRLTDIDRQFSLLRHVLGRLPGKDRIALLERMDAALGDEWTLWRENHAARKEKELPPFESLALHGAVLAQLQRSKKNDFAQIECPAERLVEFFRRWSEGLEWRAQGKRQDARALFSNAQTAYRVAAYDLSSLPGRANDQIHDFLDDFNKEKKALEHSQY